MLFAVLAGKGFLEFGGKMHFLDFGGKMRFLGFDGKMRFFGFGRKVRFYWFGRKMCFYGNVCFTFFCGKTHLAVLAGKCVFQFLRENAFLVIAEKYICKK